MEYNIRVDWICNIVRIIPKFTIRVLLLSQNIDLIDFVLLKVNGFG